MNTMEAQPNDTTLANEAMPLPVLSISDVNELIHDANTSSHSVYYDVDSTESDRPLILVNNTDPGDVNNVNNGPVNQVQEERTQLNTGSRRKRNDDAAAQPSDHNNIQSNSSSSHGLILPGYYCPQGASATVDANNHQNSNIASKNSNSADISCIDLSDNEDDDILVVYTSEQIQANQRQALPSLAPPASVSLLPQPTSAIPPGVQMQIANSIEAQQQQHHNNHHIEEQPINYSNSRPYSTYEPHNREFRVEVRRLSASSGNEEAAGLDESPPTAPRSGYGPLNARMSMFSYRKHRNKMNATKRQKRSSPTQDCTIVPCPETSEASSSKEPQSEKTIKCPICLDDEPTISSSGRQLVSTVCGHIFCRQCLAESIKMSKMCPKCRKKLTARQFHPIFL